MMNTKRSRKKSLWSYVSVFPVLLVAFAFSVTEGQNVQAQEKGNDWVNEKVEVMPEFPGGKEALFKYMIEHIKYPDDAERAGVEGKVIVKFLVDLDGSITNVGAKNSVYPSLDKLVLSVVSNMPKWNPGMQDGKPVKVEMVLPIAYKLGEKDSPNPK